MIKRLLKSEEYWVVLAGILFSILNGVFIATENFWGLAIPLVLVLIVSVFLALDKVLLFIVFFTPLSLFYYDKGMGIGFTVPTEPIMFGLMIFFFFRLLYHGSFDSKIVSHPLSLVLIFSVLWMALTTVSSQMPWISAKYLLSRMWFLAVYFYFMSQLLKIRKNQTKFFWLFMISLSMVAVFTMYKHSEYSFSREAGGWIMSPFFKEHTVYGAVLAMFVPVSAIFGFSYPHRNTTRKVLSILVFAILTLAVILSYSRAAWLSIVLASGAGFLLWIRVKRWVFLSMIGVGLFIVGINYNNIMRNFKSNQQVSSDNITEHVESISNISSDVSNLERINRWKSAFRMFAERPLLGFGPGTYMFMYAPYQKPHEKTIISTNAGDLGNAHSEYIGALAEMGFIGSIFVILTVVFTMITGVRVYKRLKDEKLRWLALGAFMGLVTYWSHAFLNNFLDMDKAACPVWGFSAFLVVLDMYFTED